MYSLPCTSSECGFKRFANNQPKLGERGNALRALNSVTIVAEEEEEEGGGGGGGGGGDEADSPPSVFAFLCINVLHNDTLFHPRAKKWRPSKLSHFIRCVAFSLRLIQSPFFLSFGGAAIVDEFQGHILSNGRGWVFVMELIKVIKLIPTAT